MEGGANEARKETTRHCQSLSVTLSVCLINCHKNRCDSSIV